MARLPQSARSGHSPDFNMIALEPRPLTSSEAAVTASAIQCAPFGDGFRLNDAYLTSQLQVVGRCDCGCASVFFSSPEWTSEHHRVADGEGFTAEGERIGIIVWATSAGLAHLELVSYSDRPALLPEPTSIR